ncbi:MAG: AEC family transporter, partial [Ferruginibacter sp.]|nr:AEC family transporter [Rhodoferax sp.]
MLSILRITFPFFALVLCGYIAARRALLPHAAIPGLNSFVLYFALPCLLYRFGASTPIAQLLDGTLVAVYLLCALGMVGLTIAVTRKGGINWNDASFGALVAAFPNTGFMGVPLLVALLGAKAAGPAIVTIVVDLLVTSSLCIALSRLDSADSHGGEIAAQKALQGVALNPLPWAILLGALTSGLQLSVPVPVMQTVGLLPDAASPVALFTIGAVLARSQMNSAIHTALMGYGQVTLIKLVLHPVLVGQVGLADI